MDTELISLYINDDLAIKEIKRVMIVKKILSKAL
jgi:hypothetical protein